MNAPLHHTVTDADPDDMYELGVTHGCKEEADRCAALARKYGQHELADLIENGKVPQ